MCLCSTQQHGYALPRLLEIYQKPPKYGNLYHLNTHQQSRGVHIRGVPLYQAYFCILQKVDSGSLWEWGLVKDSRTSDSVIAEAFLDTHCQECEHSSRAHPKTLLKPLSCPSFCIIFLIINILNLKILRFLFLELHYLPRHCQSCARPSHCEFSHNLLYFIWLGSLDSWTNHKCILVRSSLPLGLMQSN